MPVLLAAYFADSQIDVRALGSDAKSYWLWLKEKPQVIQF
jgi:hypothetical protein